jgi:hypothetical protein
MVPDGSWARDREGDEEKRMKLSPRPDQERTGIISCKLHVDMMHRS